MLRINPHWLEKKTFDFRKVRPTHDNLMSIVHKERGTGSCPHYAFDLRQVDNKGPVYPYEEGRIEFLNDLSDT